MATLVGNPSGKGVEMKEMENAELPNALSEFQPTTPHRPEETPSLPSSGIRRLNISTPIPQNVSNAKETESKAVEECESTNDGSSNDNDTVNGVVIEEEEEEEDDGSLLHSKYDYIVPSDHKELKKVCKSAPQRMYDRLQSRNLSKLDEYLQCKMSMFLEKKRTKLLLKAAAHKSGPKPRDKVWDKLEIDDDGDGDEAMADGQAANGQDADPSASAEDEQSSLTPSATTNSAERVRAKKNVEFSTEHKVAIIERALAASYQNLMYFNKLLLRPLPNVSSAAQQNEGRLSAERRAKTERIARIKREIEEKRTGIVAAIARLNAMRRAMDCVLVAIPQSVRGKMVRNIDYDDIGGLGLEEAAKQERTEQVLVMMNENKKAEMVALDGKREELRENEVRLKERALQIESEGERLSAFIELKKRNRLVLDREQKRRASIKTTTMMMMDEVDEVDQDRVDEVRVHHEDGHHGHVQLTVDRVEDQDRERETDGVDGHGIMSRNRHRTLSMASSVGSTIHGSLSPQIMQKLLRRQETEKWTFGTMRRMHSHQRDLLF